MEEQYHTEDSTLLTSDPLPSSVDWSTKGVVTPVRDQGQIESSHAFTAADAVSRWGENVMQRCLIKCDIL